MLRKTLVFCALLGVLICLSSLQAHAQTSRLYFAGYAGLNTFNDQPFEESTGNTSGELGLNNGQTFAGALGIRLSQFFRAEAELSYGKSTFTSIRHDNGGLSKLGGQMKSYLSMLNIYYDFDVPTWQLQPFVSAGAGFYWHEGQIADGAGPAVDLSSGDASGIAWQLGGGLKYRITPDFALSGGYRYVDGTDLDMGSYKIDYGAHEFRVGFEYDLPID